MKGLVITLGLALALGLTSGCAKKQKFHQTDLPGPETYAACFRDIDGNGDETVTWEEFKSYFPQAEPRVFAALDLNNDKVIDHNEWHDFEEAHGAQHKHGSKSY
jgi:hypothetical protein